MLNGRLSVDLLWWIISGQGKQIALTYNKVDSQIYYERRMRLKTNKQNRTVVHSHTCNRRIVLTLLTFIGLNRLLSEAVTRTMCMPKSDSSNSRCRTMWPRSAFVQSISRPAVKWLEEFPCLWATSSARYITWPFGPLSGSVAWSVVIKYPRFSCTDMWIVFGSVDEFFLRGSSLICGLVRSNCFTLFSWPNLISFESDKGWS